MLTQKFYMQSRSVFLSCYIVIRDAVYHFYSCEIYWFKLFTVLYILLVLPIEPISWLLVIQEINVWNKFTLQIPESTHFLYLRQRCHFRSGDRLRYILGIVPGIICDPIWRSFAVLGSFAGRDHLRACTMHSRRRKRRYDFSVARFFLKLVTLAKWGRRERIRMLEWLGDEKRRRNNCAWIIFQRVS